MKNSIMIFYKKQPDSQCVKKSTGVFLMISTGWIWLLVI